MCFTCLINSNRIIYGRYYYGSHFTDGDTETLRHRDSKGSSRIQADSSTHAVNHYITWPRDSQSAVNFSLATDTILIGHFSSQDCTNDLAVNCLRHSGRGRGQDTLEPSVLIASCAGSYKKVTVAAGLKN